MTCGALKNLLCTYEQIASVLGNEEVRGSDSRQQLQQNVEISGFIDLDGQMGVADFFMLFFCVHANNI